MNIDKHTIMIIKMYFVKSPHLLYFLSSFHFKLYKTNVQDKALHEGNYEFEAFGAKRVSLRSEPKTCKFFSEQCFTKLESVGSFVTFNLEVRWSHNFFAGILDPQNTLGQIMRGNFPQNTKRITSLVLKIPYTIMLFLPLAFFWWHGCVRSAPLSCSPCVVRTITFKVKSILQ